jgi:hypothetical protein
LSSCSKVNDKAVPTSAVKDNTLKGKITEGFKNAQWSNYENKKQKANFTSKEISNYSSSEYTLSDAFEKDKDIFAVMQKSEGEVEYFKITGDVPTLTAAYNGEVLDSVITDDISENEELWGFQKYKEYELVVKNSCTDIFKDGVKLNSVEGVASIGDIDSNGTVELIQRNIEGRTLTVYQIINDNFIKVWELSTDNETFDGDIQIGDLNGDGVSEFYVGDTNGNMIKFVLTKNGFEEDKTYPILNDSKSGTYFIVDYNHDNKQDIVTTDHDKKAMIYIQN